MSKKVSCYGIAISLLLVLSILVELIMWITLFSRMGLYSRELCIPFGSYYEIFHGNKKALTENIENIVMFMPIGAIINLFHNKKLSCTIIYGIVVSLLIESAQWLFWLGSFETDDIIHNSVGTLFGAIITDRLKISQLIDVLLDSKKKRMLTISLFYISIVLFSVVPLSVQLSHISEMKDYAMLSNLTDGRQNLLLLTGKPGYAGKSNVYISYNSDGTLNVNGESTIRAWKIIGSASLPPGDYYFTGLMGVEEHTIALELEYFDNKQLKFKRLIPDVGATEKIDFTLETRTIVRASVGVYPGADENIIIRPAIYYEE